ncbi:hypothetical protein [Leifsonia sp. WHRI 6310E]|uniref:hypothetical protein n=1 Tax=Leifsonia sp. WHRI 6310E TaxID=3162562 RepID=UPI0032EC1DDF
MGGNTGIRILTAVGLAVALGGVRGVGPAAVAAFYVAAVTVPLVVTDVREQRLPNALVLPGYAFAALGLAWDALARGSPGADAGAAVVGVVPVVAAGSGAVAVVAVGVGVLGLFVMLAWTGGLGMGDAKLAGLLAIVLGAVGPVGVAGAAVPAGAVGAVAPLRVAVPVLVWVVAVFLAAALHGVIEGVVRRWSRGREALGRESRGSEALGNEAPGSEGPGSEGPGSRRGEVAFGPAMLGAFWMVVIAV